MTFLWFLAGIFAAREATAQTVVYVDSRATSLGSDGLTWCSAYRSLSDVLSIAMDGFEIRVAGGVYYPDSTGLHDSREASFNVPPGVKIAGGYGGCESLAPDQRGFDATPSILSGDLQKNDKVGDLQDNCYQVVRASNSGIATLYPSVIEGFTITAGNANGLGFPTGNAVGGGIYTVGDVNVSLCTIINNRATFAAGMFNLEGNAIASQCIFRENVAEWGGAFGIFGYATVQRVNDLDPGGTVAHGSPRVLDCVFESNVAVQSGGAIWVQGVQMFPSVNNSVFRANRSGGDGGALFLSGTDHLFRNCLFVQNASQAKGGVGWSVAQARFRNCTFANNDSASGGALHADPASLLLLEDCILWGNSSSEPSVELAQIGGVTPDLLHCMVQGWSGTWGGIGNNGTDPLFVAGPAGYYYLSQTLAGQPQQSLAVDSGSVFSLSAGLNLRTTRFDESFDTNMVDRGYHYGISGDLQLFGDANLDGRTDLRDAALFQFCAGQDAGSDGIAQCRPFDFQWDGLIDLDDYVSFLAALDLP